MNVDVIILSEYARAFDGNRLMIVGTLNRVSGPKLPVLVAPLFISIVVEAHWDERGKEHELELRIINADREPLLEKPAITRWRFADAEPLPGMFLRHTQVSRLFLQFPATGPYAFEVYIDGVYHASTNLYVHVPEG